MNHSAARNEGGTHPETLRIGMFSESFDPVQNGVTTSVLTLVSGLRALNHHACVFAPAHERRPAHELNVLRFPSFESAFNRGYPLAYPFLPRLALETHFDGLKLQIVHTHTPFVLGLTGAKLALRRGVPLVSTFHTLYTRYSHYVPLLPESVTQSLIERYLPWYYNRCSQIICPSAVAEQALRDLGVIRPIEIIPTGIPLPPKERVNADARRAAREMLGIPPAAPILLYAGRLAPEKNLEWLLRLFVDILAAHPDARLVLAGGGDLVDGLQELAQTLQIRDRTVFLGPTPRSEMDPLYATADVFCFPAPSETQGLVVGEARAAGTPCVVVNAGGAPETVRDGEDGFRTPGGDADAFKARILDLLQDPSMLASMRAAARKNARQYTPERMVQRVLAIYAAAQAEERHPIDLDFRPIAEELDLEGTDDALYEGPDLAESALGNTSSSP